MPYYYEIGIDSYESGCATIFVSKKRLNKRKFLRRVHQTIKNCLETAIANESDFYWDDSGDGLIIGSIYQSEEFSEEIQRFGFVPVDGWAYDDLISSCSSTPSPLHRWVVFEYCSTVKGNHYDKHDELKMRLLRQDIPDDLKIRVIEISKEYQKNWDRRLKKAFTKKYGSM